MTKREQFVFCSAVWPVFFLIMIMTTIAFWTTPGIILIVSLAVLAFVILGGRLTYQAYREMKEEEADALA